jgi:hypothetical protein
VGNNPVNFTDPEGLLARQVGNGAAYYYNAFADLGRDTLRVPGVQLSLGAGALAGGGALAANPAGGALLGLGLEAHNLATSDVPVGAGSGFAAKYGPLNPGPLAQDIANTFRSGTYTGRTLSSDETLYRVISESGNPTGSYWTTVKPQGSLQSVIDSALDQNWGNTATSVITAQVPAGTTIYEGAAAAQRGLVGGGNQIYIPKVDSSWIVP